MLKEISEKNLNFITVSKETLNDDIEILNCELRFKYYYFNEINNEYLIKIDVLFEDGRKFSNFLKSSDFIDPKIFRRNLAKIAPGAIYSGTKDNLNNINNTILPKLRKVILIDTVGYLNEYKCYVFSNFGIKNGKIFIADEDGIINFNKDLSIKIKQANIDFTINKDLLSQINSLPKDLINNIYQAFGEKGIIAIVYWFGSLFAEQIRDKYQTFPFLEMSGEASTGKTTLIEFLWKLLGQTNKEGITAKEASEKGLWRSLSQISNVPIVFIESDSGDTYSNKGKFNWDKFKSLYSGRGLRLQGVKDNSNTTQEYPFKSSLAVVQNREIKGRPEITERFVSLYFNSDDINKNTAVYANKLVNLEVEELSNFLILALKNEQLVLNKFEENYQNIKSTLQDTTDIHRERLLKNYSQMLVLLDSFATIFDVEETILKKTRKYLIDLFVKKEKITNEDTDIVKDFFETYEFIENIFNKKSNSIINHSRDSRYIAINLNHYAQVAKKSHQYIPHLNILREELKFSKKYKFIGCKYINSAVIKSKASEEKNKGKTIYCWIFEKNTDNEKKSIQETFKNSKDDEFKNSNLKETVKNQEQKIVNSDNSVSASNIVIKDTVSNLKKLNSTNLENTNKYLTEELKNKERAEISALSTTNKIDLNKNDYFTKLQKNLNINSVNLKQNDIDISVNTVLNKTINLIQKNIQGIKGANYGS